MIQNQVKLDFTRPYPVLLGKSRKVDCYSILLGKLDLSSGTIKRRVEFTRWSGIPEPLDLEKSRDRVITSRFTRPSLVQLIQHSSATLVAALR